MTAVRPAAVAGMFYPDDPDALSALLDGLLTSVPDGDAPAPKAIIAPHAGYAFSGSTAARVYARLRSLRGQVTRVVLLGPVHRVPVRGLALSSAEAWETPLGPVPLDRAAAEALADLPQVVTEDRAHAAEHSLEVHLPFLRAVLGDGFALVPLAVGDARPEAVAEVLERLWGGPETLIVISSDLSHFHDYDTCKRVDARTVSVIEGLRFEDLEYDDACGRLPIAGLLKVARDKGLGIETVDVSNSGDTGGPPDRVVGYGAWALTERARGGGARAVEGDDTDALLSVHGPALLGLAGHAIYEGLRDGCCPPVVAEDLAEPLRADGAAFVTLKRQGALRGCIGSVMAHRALGLDVVENAWRAAFRDPRFAPLTAAEVAGLEVSVSVLTPSWTLEVADEADLLAQMRPGVDGLILSVGRHRGLFLPAVWEQLPKPEDFLAHLKIKAGLPPGYWSPDLTVERFEARGVSGPLGPLTTEPVPVL